MREPLSEIAVVGEENEAFGLRIETANVEETGKFCRQKIEMVSRACTSFRVETKPAGLCSMMVSGGPA